MTRRIKETQISIRVVETIESDDQPPQSRPPRKCVPRQVIETTIEPFAEVVPLRRAVGA